MTASALTAADPRHKNSAGSGSRHGTPDHGSARNRALGTAARKLLERPGGDELRFAVFSWSSSCPLPRTIASEIAYRPFTSNIDGVITVDGEQVVCWRLPTKAWARHNSAGPTWDIRNYFLGADTQAET